MPVATADVPTNAEEEIQEYNLFLTGPDHLRPRGVTHYLRHGCVVEFQATHTLHSFPPEDHWCLIEKPGSYEIRSWRAAAATEGPPDNPATPQDESGPDTPHTEQDVLVREFPIQLALDLRQLWLQAIMQSRYPPSVLGGLDGTTYTFTVERYASGEFISADVWTPTSDRPPTWMVELASRIYAIASGGMPFDDQLLRDTAATKLKMDEFYAPKDGPRRVPLHLLYVIAGAALLSVGVILGRRSHAS